MAEGQQDLTKQSILLVEDDPNDVILIRRAFSKANIPNPLQVVDDGEMAVNYLSGNGNYSNRVHYPIPILVLLDLKMPRKSGLEVLQWIRQHEQLKRLPVIILTSSRENADIDRAYEIGVNSYLVKPVTFDALLGLVTIVRDYWLSINRNPESSRKESA